MKKVIAFLFTLIILNVQAQDKFAIGIKLGQNFTSVDNVNVDHNSASYHLGVTAQIGITPLLSIVPEVILSQTKLEANPSVLALAIDPTLKPGDLSLIDDFIDFTSGRADTFYDGVQPGGVSHVDVVGAYDKGIRAGLAAAAKKLGLSLRESGVYAGFNGPRFETPAEIRLAALAGATVVGMTGCPEVTLAKEANLRYAAIALVVNPAAGVSDQPITMEDISACLKQATVKVIQIIDAAITEI